MIHSIGDSHAYYTFAGIPGVLFQPLGPVTMRRLGSGRVRKGHKAGEDYCPDKTGVEYEPDTLLQSKISRINPNPSDVIIISCGEGDVRCFIKPHLERTGEDVEPFLAALATAYVARMTALDANGARIGIASITPPTTRERASTVHWPAAGTDAERVSYARTINRTLAEKCAKHGLLFVDTYADFSDADGMIRIDLADKGVHVRHTQESARMLHDKLIALGMLPPRKP